MRLRLSLARFERADKNGRRDARAIHGTITRAHGHNIATGIDGDSCKGVSGTGITPLHEPLLSATAAQLPGSKRDASGHCRFTASRTSPLLSMSNLGSSLDHGNMLLTMA